MFMSCWAASVHLMEVLESFYLLQFQRPSWDPWAAFNLPVIKRMSQRSAKTWPSSRCDQLLVTQWAHSCFLTSERQDENERRTNWWQIMANVCKCWMSSGPELKEVIGSVIRFLLSTVSGRNNEIPNFYSGSLSTRPSLGLTCLSRIVFPASLHNLSSDKSTNPTCWERCYYRGVPCWFILQDLLYFQCKMNSLFQTNIHVQYITCVYIHI